MGGKENGYKLGKSIDGEGVIHYWLENKRHEIIDPTSEQYTDLGKPLPYKKYRVKTGISYMYSNSAKKLIELLSGR